MSDIQNGADPNAVEQAATGGAPVTIMAQYVKDLSFENPHAPATLRQSDERPSMDANFSMDAKKVEWEGDDSVYEVTLGIRTEAQRGSQTAFICEIEYCVLVSLKNVPEDQHHPMLLIEMPRYAFPFVRMIISNLTQQAGYMPLLLSPVDFRALYMQRFAAEMEQQQQQQQSAAQG